uniref:hypothetical protein n=1 Tax=Spirosoma foliorum TaxID=2710596 RepID=UPI001F0A5F20|nr:hypothetical protein [Spirosoma foliorum]
MDDFVTPFEQWLASRTLTESGQPTRQTDLTASEIITLLVYYHHSGYKNFQYYYQRLVSTRWLLTFLNWSVMADLLSYCPGKQPPCIC